jgi:hypothetical protein
MHYLGTGLSPRDTDLAKQEKQFSVTKDLVKGKMFLS